MGLVVAADFAAAARTWTLWLLALPCDPLAGRNRWQWPRDGGELRAAKRVWAGLVPEPFIAAYLATDLLVAGGEAALLLPAFSGEVILPAWQTDADSLSPAPRDAERRFIPAAGAADYVVVPVLAEDDVEIIVVPASDQEVVLQGTQDGGFYGRFVPMLGDARVVGRIARDEFDAAINDAALCSAAYLLGLAQQAFERTLAYLRERRQFDKPLVSFQALQPRCADLQVQLVLTRASVERAAHDLDHGLEGRARFACVSRAKARATDTALLVAKEAIHLHGAIGYTDEHDIGLFVRRAMTVATQFGTARQHRARFLAAVVHEDLAA